jgi:hypothetical protein
VETLENEHVEENNDEELVQLVDFEEKGSVRRKLWRMNMWRRTLPRSLFSWWILKRGSVRRRLWRMTMWRRTMLRRIMVKRLCR